MKQALYSQWLLVATVNFCDKIVACCVLIRRTPEQLFRTFGRAMLRLVAAMTVLIFAAPSLAFAQSASGSYWMDPNNNTLEFKRFSTAQALCDARAAIANWPTPLLFFVNANNDATQPDAGTCRYAPYENYMVLGTDIHYWVNCSGATSVWDSSALACVATPPVTCPITPLTPITDPVALEHENGKYSKKPDLERLNDATKVGLACILQKTAGFGGQAYPSSGYRPPQYQAHFFEVYQKWLLLKDNDDPACKDIKESVLKEQTKHKILVTYQTSPHTSGNAVDIQGVPPDQADAIASQCNMYRPLPKKDHVHYIPR